MKISRRVPPVHIRRLRQAAQEAGCTGLLACINAMSQSFLNRKKMTNNDISRTPIRPDNDPVLEAAWNEMIDILEAKYAEKEKQIEAESAHEEDVDCTVIPRFLIQVAETVPTLRPEVRMPLDRYFSQMAHDHLTV